MVNWEWDVISKQGNIKNCHLNHSEPSWCPGTARQLHLWMHLKDTSSIGSKQLARKLAMVNWEWDVISKQGNVKECHLNHSEPSGRPGTARQLHLWIHLKDTSSIGSKQLACTLVIVNCKWDVILRHDNVKVCHLNYSEPSWRPATAHQLLLWRHLKDLSSKGGRQLAPELAILNWEWDII